METGVKEVELRDLWRRYKDDGDASARQRPVVAYQAKVERFDGSPTLLVLDEAWLFLDSPIFAARIREWLKTLRKKHVAVVFATQSLADIADSPIAPALIESCPTRIYLPNRGQTRRTWGNNMELGTEIKPDPTYYVVRR